MRKAFEKELGLEIIVPEHFAVMGAIGSAVLALEKNPVRTNFKGFDVADKNFVTSSFICDDCPNMCEIVVIEEEGKISARWGSRCGKWNV